jgi:hypothetical protein
MAVAPLTIRCAHETQAEAIFRMIEFTAQLEQGFAPQTKTKKVPKSQRQISVDIKWLRKQLV